MLSSSGSWPNRRLSWELGAAACERSLRRRSARRTPRGHGRSTRNAGHSPACPTSYTRARVIAVERDRPPRGLTGTEHDHLLRWPSGRPGPDLGVNIVGRGTAAKSVRSAPPPPPAPTGHDSATPARPLRGPGRPVMTTAVVLSGGGSLGAVQVGMLQALGERGVTPDLLVGVHRGARRRLRGGPRDVAPCRSAGGGSASHRDLELHDLLVGEAGERSRSGGHGLGRDQQQAEHGRRDGRVPGAVPAPRGSRSPWARPRSANGTGGPGTRRRRADPAAPPRMRPAPLASRKFRALPT